MPATAQATDPSVDQAFQSDWDTAQQRYRAGVNAGYSEEDADQLYLAPVRNKWDILKDVPPAMQSKAAQELNDAQVSFIKNVYAGYKPEDANNLVLAPVEQKWQAAADIHEPARPDPLIADKVGALQEAGAGYDPIQVLNDHPRAIFSDPEYVKQFEAAALRGQKEKVAATTKAGEVAAKQNDPVQLFKEISTLGKLGDSSMTNAPAAVQDSLKQAIGKLESQVTGLQPRVSFNLPADDGLPSKPTGAPEKFATKFRTPQEVKDAYHSKELNQDEATKILRDQFGMQ